MGQQVRQEVFCVELPGKIPSLANHSFVCVLPYTKRFFFLVHPNIHSQMQSLSFKEKDIGVFPLLNTAINLSFTLSDDFCLLAAIDSWASVDRRGHVSDGFLGGLSVGSLRSGQ